MKKYILIFCLFFLAAEWAFSGALNAGTITVKITGFKNDKGFARAAIFNSAEGYPEYYNVAFGAKQVAVQNGQAELTFENVPYGDYAISVFHDENANGRLNRNFFGKPTEGVGFSNNPPKTSHAPSFNDAKFTLSEENKQIEIKLLYY